RSPLFITLVAQIAVPIGLCFILQAAGQLDASRIWLAIVLGHFTRCVLSAARFHQPRWQRIAVALARSSRPAPLPHLHLARRRSRTSSGAGACHSETRRPGLTGTRRRSGSAKVVSP